MSVIIRERFRDFNRIFVEISGGGMGFPAAVRGFMVAHEEEGGRFLALLEEGEGFLGYDVCDVAWYRGLGAAATEWEGIDECWVVVETLAWEDGPGTMQTLDFALYCQWPRLQKVVAYHGTIAGVGIDRTNQ